MTFSTAELRSQLSQMMSDSYEVDRNNLSDIEVRGLQELSDLSSYVAQVGPQSWEPISEKLVAAWEVLLHPISATQAFDTLFETVSDLTGLMPMNRDSVKLEFADTSWFEEVESSNVIMTHLRIWLDGSRPHARLYPKEYRAWQSMSALLLMAGTGPDLGAPTKN